MILYKLHQKEIEINKTVEKNHKKLVSITVLKTLLHQVDYNAEIIPANRLEHLVKLLSHVKCSELNKSELKLLKQLLK